MFAPNVDQLRSLEHASGLDRNDSWGWRSKEQVCAVGQRNQETYDDKGRSIDDVYFAKHASLVVQDLHCSHLHEIPAGLILGTLALRSRSIWGGVLLHVAVAWSTDLVAIVRRGWPSW